MIRKVFTQGPLQETLLGQEGNLKVRKFELDKPSLNVLFGLGLCGIKWPSQPSNFLSKGRSQEFIQFIYCFLKAFMLSLHSSLVTFCGKK